jgi:hypothetical protein
MATRSTDVNRVFEFNGDMVLNDIPMIASDTIYAGSAVGESASTGNARPLVGGDAFLGFAVAQVTNGATIGANNVRVRQKGVVKLAVTGVTADDDLGIAIYASDDDTFSTTSTSTSTQIGKLVRWVSSTTCYVYFEAAGLRSIG